MSRKIKTKKGIAPMITVILIVVVAVILGAIILTWSRESSSNNLNTTKGITNYQADAGNYVYPEKVDDGKVSLNYNPPAEIEDKQIFVVAYKIIADNIETSEVTLDEPIPLEDGSNVINLESFADLEITASKITIVLRTSDDQFITLENVSNINIPLQVVATPTADPEPGTFYDGYVEVSLSSTTDGAQIYYTTDGSTPTTESDSYSETITFYETTTLQAIAVKEGYENSEIFSGEYTISVMQR